MADERDVQKLNKSVPGVSVAPTLEETKLSEIREKFKKEALVAKEKAEMRILALEYERKYRKSLQKKIELSKKRAAEVAKAPEDTKESVLAKEKLKEEKLLIDERLKSGDALLAILKEKSKALQKNEEKVAEVPPVSQNNGENTEKTEAPKPKKRALKPPTRAKRELRVFTAGKKETGIKLGFKPSYAPVYRIAPKTLPIFPYAPTERYRGTPEYYPERMAHIPYAPSPVCEAKTPDTELSFGGEYFGGERNGSALGAAFAGGAAAYSLGGKRAGERSGNLEFSTPEANSFAPYQSKQNFTYPPLAEDRQSYEKAPSQVPYITLENEPFYEPQYEAFSDAKAEKSVDYGTYSDLDSYREDIRYESNEPLDFPSRDFEKYTDVEGRNAPYFEPYTDVEGARTPHFEQYTDVEGRNAPYFEPYTDVEGARTPHFEQYTDVEGRNTPYFEPYTDVEGARTPHFEQYTDADSHYPVRFDRYTDADIVSAPQFERYSDTERYASPYFERYTDIDTYASPRFDTYSDVEGGLVRVPEYEDPYHYGSHSMRESDERALAAYEAMLLKKGKRAAHFATAQSEPHYSELNYSPDTEINEELDCNFSAFSKKELFAHLKMSEKRIKACKKEIMKKTRSMRKLSSIDKTKALVDIVNINKHIVDYRATALVAIVAIKDKKHRRLAKKELSIAINEYNSALCDCEARGGERLPKIPLSIVTDILNERPYRKIPILNYRDEKQNGVFRDPFDDIQYEDFPNKNEKKREKLRVAREAALEERRMKKLIKLGGKAKAESDSFNRLPELRSRIERNNEAVRLRFEYEITSLEAKRDFLVYSFHPVYKEKRREEKALIKQIKTLKKTKKKALKYERLDSERYYSQLVISAEGAGIIKHRKALKLDSDLMRLDALINERERINEQLMKIYSGNLRGEGDKKINKRLKKIKRRAAKKTARRFRRDMRILDTRIPLDIKEKLTKCANMVIEAELNIKSLKYKLRKSGVRGAARRDMKRAIKENRAKIKYHVRDYRRFLKKAKRYVEKIKVVRKQIVAILITIAVLVVATLLYLRFESQVNGFFARIFRFVR